MEFLIQKMNYESINLKNHEREFELYKKLNFDLNNLKNYVLVNPNNSKL